MNRRYDYRRKLPHLQPDHKVFFITFCTAKRWNLPERARAVTLNTCTHDHGSHFRLYAAVVMPDHVHLLLSPRADSSSTISIPEIMQRIKSSSAHQINKALGRAGKVWQDESFDRALRREEDLAGKIEYILGNPVRAGLVTDPWDYPWLWCENNKEQRCA